MVDLIIIGGGPAGYHAAERASEQGLSVIVFEKRKLGGVCLNEGCVPSKALLHSAKIFDYANRDGKSYGVTCETPKLDYSYAVSRKDKVVKKLIAGVEVSFKKKGVTLVNEEAYIEKRISGGFEITAGGKSYQTGKILLCCGSESVTPPVEGMKEAFLSGFAITSREILSSDSNPPKMVIIGGGVIGIEMASLMNSALCDVTIIEMTDKIAGPTDSEISNLLQKNYEKKGVKFLLSATVTKIGSSSVTYEQSGKEGTIDCDKVLVSVGRRAVTDGIGLENIGVYIENGAVPTDDTQKTNVPGVYAAGDINGKYMLAHTAYREAEVAVNNICGKKDFMEYNAVPSVIYTNPEAAGVGETLASAASKGIDAHEVKVPMMYSGRYMAENEGGDGICKLVISGNRLIGAHMLGNHCSEMITTATMAISKEISLEQFKKIIFPHPSVTEIIRDALFVDRKEF
jgi:dihydrolipoamide dehydrogenase